MRVKNFFIQSTAFLLGLTMTVALAHGAPITWTTVGDVAGEGSVNTDGFLLTAVNSNTGPVTVNGVPFSGGGNPLGGGFGVAYGANAFTPALNTLLTGASFGPSGTSFELTGLTAGDDYLVQLFATDDRGCCAAREVSYEDGLGNASAILAGIGVPKFAIGTFTADAATQTIVAIRNDTIDDTNSYINAYQVRSTTPLPPQPSMTVVHGQAVVDRANTDTFFGSVIHDNPIEDGSGDTDDPGRLTSWRFFNNNIDADGRLITPLLIERIGGDNVVRGIGTTRTVSADGEQQYAFDLAQGTDTFDWSLGTFRMGIRYGSPDVANPGVVDFDNAGGSWTFIGDGAGAPPIVLGAAVTGAQSFAALGRDYSVQFTVEPVPEPTSLLLLLCGAMCSVMGYRRRSRI